MEKEIKYLNEMIEACTNLREEQNKICLTAELGTREYKDACQFRLMYACRLSVYEEMKERLEKY